MELCCTTFKITTHVTKITTTAKTSFFTMEFLKRLPIVEIEH